MKVEIIKSGHYALHPALGPIVSLVEGQELSSGSKVFDTSGKKIVITQKNLYSLVDDEWADILEGSEEPEEESFEPVKVVSEEGEDEDVEDRPDISDLIKLIDDVEDVDKKKAMIQDWGTLNTGQKVSKAKTPENMIKEIESYL